MVRIVLLSAIPQEYRPLLERIGKWERWSLGSRRAYMFRDSARDLFLVETGMGRKNIDNVIEAVIERASVDLFISIGFAGSLSQLFGVGQVILADRFTLGNNFGGVGIAELCIKMTHELTGFCEAFGIQRAQTVTVDTFADKMALAPYYSDTPSIIDMESTYVALAAAKAKVPILCFRSISDALTDSLGFEMCDIADENGVIRISKVCRSVIQNPRILESLYDSWKRSTKAARQLGYTLWNFMNMSTERLEEIIDGTHVAKAWNPRR